MGIDLISLPHGGGPMDVDSGSPTQSSEDVHVTLCQLLPCTSIDSLFGGLVNKPPEPIKPPSRFYIPTFAHGILTLGGGSLSGDEVF